MPARLSQRTLRRSGRVSTGGAEKRDFLDGYLARAWKQESKLGAMLDPIADKAMVVIALLVITGFSGMDPWILLPATVIIFREVFVSGLREFIGAAAGTLKVTKLAKWKTTAQMVAILLLLYDAPVGVFPTRDVGLVLVYVAAALTPWPRAGAAPLLVRKFAGGTGGGGSRSDRCGRG